MSKPGVIAKLAACVLVAGLLVAGILFPYVGGVGLISNRAADTVDNISSELLEGQVPEVTTVTDNTGAPIAYLYDQRRVQVPFDQISPNMVRSIISIEDKRFMEHDGVDYQGTLRAFLKNQSAGEVQQGASTLDQQYIKNYQLLVLARSDADRRAATETTPARKLREVRMALSLERTLTERAKQERGVDDAQAKLIAKEQILARYLNLVPFGNGAYGIEVAAQTYFGKRASQLSIPESAMLAGMVQSSSALNPYTNPQGVTDRRNLVLDTLVQNFPDKAAEYQAAKSAPLGVLPRPNTLPGGCISAVGGRGYFCDYVQQYLAQAGIPKEQVVRGGYTIRTTLDPRVQDSVQAALSATASPTLSNVAQVMNVIKPGDQSHDIVAMSSSRVYGLDVAKRQTVQPEPFAQVGDGAGSTFKIFTVAAAMEKGMGLDTNVSVPSTVSVKGMGSGGLPGCPANSYCVKNAGNYPSNMSLTQALATSPNTPFVKMIEQVGVTPVVDMAVKLGLRSYTQPGSSGFGNDSLADMFKKQNLASFTLGPTAVSALELTNVAATLASGGVWCPPNPIQSITQPKRNSDGIQTVGADGRPETTPVPFKSEKCEQVIDKGLADTLANALSADDRGAGTSAGAASRAGWTLPLSGKTGTTETFRSSAFLAYTNQMAGASYVYNDGDSPGPICTSPLRPCGEGNVYGGNEPATAWYTAMRPVATLYGPIALPPVDPKFKDGFGPGKIPNIIGLNVNAAKARLESAGFKTTVSYVNNTAPKDTVVSTSPSGFTQPGSTITLNLSNGIAPAPTVPVPGVQTGPGGTTITIPGFGQFTIPGAGGQGGGPVQPPAPNPPGN
ncbi:peptidoglycan glycosyltransferase OS=Tsukamurella paurometabola (strain ATCC 8368 / DSM / CCUG 35730 / CIP 100753 / JCM 10117 / KCTC 9821 / NBRC 16120 /NCIMB 702349 / NCTC 13040) OX=521096 GN=Tpau_3939 PE=4 SV=1 [Tsukamurella paurometabola]|uniref:Peptidoglycan glycosyltransferase n=1 Tax=Tsukamurella paurometabola (strain ATCC 8368 / DSM 20162 / CCUG 35730 / CIP 100753 / JCM 10117 / KCTC 9821 / NBRC 16120 / NCIMB 702349 / NCTC 13040) TaxID=521096 RepID=D5UMN7_TSUPD|nr:transglycosylase domain-containing protein [Tsukamurella paurometabola]ADG80511.1 Peptidoglycan glycosyltransferase [Tsukamurella paurometabola DSM 20162]SUP39916.1 Penicillin-binding protein 1A [Tsukamurella paurometabola]